MTDFVPASRRELLTAIGKAGGAAMLYQAMTALGHAEPTQFKGPPQLGGGRSGATVLVLGAGLGGMLAAYELAKAGYKVKVLEYQNRAGGRNWSLRGGDVYTELGGKSQKVSFAPGNYHNPGPWRIPHHHRMLLHYCKQFGVALEPFIQMNHNTFVHNADAFGGKPQRYKALAVDFKGHVSELLAKATNQKALDGSVSKEDQEKLLEALKGWGVLDKDYRYKTSLQVSAQRGYDRAPGGGVDGAPTPSEIFALDDVLDSRVWNNMSFYFNYVMQTTMFQPVGGMDMIGKAFAREIGNIVTYNAKVTKLTQDENGVTATYQDLASGAVRQEKADWCVCALPGSVANGIDLQVSPEMKAAIGAVGYSSTVKTGLEFKRRFWEEDDHIYGGHTFTSQPISTISYPNYNYFKDGPAVLLGSNASDLGAHYLASLDPEERVAEIVRQGAHIHPQYKAEFLSGVAVAWARVPWTVGGNSRWTDAAREQHYKRLVTMDGRIAFAGEYASYYGGWMEGALLSGLAAITQLHEKVQAA